MNEKKIHTNPEFKHSPDYRSYAAQAVQLLHEQYLNGTPEVGKDYILEELGTPSKRLRDIFQCCPRWKELIVPGEKRGTYRLNLQ